jgi:exopolysaccharide biosynthesis WecB/TagA/CpsF family protein
MLLIKNYINKSAKNIASIPPRSGVAYTFINYHNYFEATKSQVDYSQFHSIGVDGIILVKLFNFFFNVKINRISFDMTSLAPVVFDYAIEKDKSIYFIGSKEHVVNNFISTLLKKYKNINILGWRHGYFKNEKEKMRVIKDIIYLNPDIIVIGMGCPLQDQFSLLLHENNFRGTSYTCGGFFHQAQKSLKHYPKYVSELNLRFLYRSLTEKHVFIRNLKNFTFFMINFIIEYPHLRSLRKTIK